MVALAEPPVAPAGCSAAPVIARPSVLGLVFPSAAPGGATATPRAAPSARTSSRDASYGAPAARSIPGRMDWKLESCRYRCPTWTARSPSTPRRPGSRSTHDHQVSDDLRFVQINPPGSACSIALGTSLSDMAPGSVRGLQVVVGDIAAAHAELAGRGVEVSEIQHMPWGDFVFFADPDGNTWSVQAIPRASRRGRHNPAALAEVYEHWGRGDFSPRFDVYADDFEWGWSAAVPRGGSRPLRRDAESQAPRVAEPMGPLDLRGGGLRGEGRQRGDLHPLPGSREDQRRSRRRRGRARLEDARRQGSPPRGLLRPRGRAGVDRGRRPRRGS